MLPAAQAVARGVCAAEDSVTLKGPAFPILVKALATLTVGALLAFGLSSAELLVAVPWSIPAALFMTATLGVICVCYCWILVSTTSIDGSNIRQSWIWDKQVALADIRDVKFIYLPHLAWLIAPRLVVRARGGVLYTFHATDREVLQRFAALRFGATFEP